MPDIDPYVIKQGARRPYLRVQLLGGDDGLTPVDLTDASSVDLIAEPHGGGSATTYPMTFEDRDDGIVQYQPSSAFTTSAVVRDGEYRVTWDDGTTERFPVSGTHTLIVEASVS
jgi:hypothetical protein